MAIPPIRTKPLVRLLALALGLPGIAACSASDTRGDHIGYVEAEWVYVAAPRAGWIESRPVREGQRVAAGDLLFTLDDQSQQAATAEAGSRVEQAQAQARDIATGARAPEVRALQAELDAAQSALALARARRDRVLALANDGFASNQQRDEAVSAFNTAQARARNAEEQIAIARQAGRPESRAAAQAGVEAARASSRAAGYELEQRSIRAEAPAEVSETFLNKGEYATAGSPVLALLPDDGLRVQFNVSESEVPAYQPGTKLRISADGLTDPVQGEVVFVATEAEFTPPVIYSRESHDKLVFLVKAAIPAGTGLRPGLPVDVSGP